ncbi:MAG TPA: hypothetical protein VGS12_18745 [Caulobacteraceae bacterium]|nr:hypothetical protein [Caulobacteraceae bacterium]
MFRDTGTLPHRAHLLRFDVAARDFRRSLAERFQLGAGLADADLQILWSLSRSIRSAAAEWQALARSLVAARTGVLSAPQARALVLEAVFDPVLEPDAGGALAAAVEVP